MKCCLSLEWCKGIHNVKHVVHNPNIPKAVINNKNVLLARQADDVKVFAENKDIVDQVLKLLTDEGARVNWADQPKFNGLDANARK